MKTFEEAFQETTKDHALLLANVKAMGEEYAGIDPFLLMLEKDTIAFINGWNRCLMTDGTVVALMSYVSRFLLSAFAIGQITGMKMEQNEQGNL